MSRGRKRFEDMSIDELLAYEQSSGYAIGRAAAFDYGNPATILEYWTRDEPSHSELLAIVRNLLRRAP